MEGFGANFYIEIGFKRDSENPSRIFKAMSDIINAFQELDNDLIKGIDSHLEPVILLEDVEAGSLRTWLLSQIKGIPDEIIQEGEWKRIVGHFLVKAKHILINKLEGYTEISDAEIIRDIQKEIEQAAITTNLKRFPHYTPISVPALIRSIDNITGALTSLSNEDTAFLHSDLGETNFNMKLAFAPSDIEDLLTKETIENTTQLILKVKKPDYLGQSMWDFKYDGKQISAKILDIEWLSMFHKRMIDIRPGDSIKADLKTKVKYGYDNEIVGQSYEVLKVYDILPLKEYEQGIIDL